jgi:hypothetical protein
METGKPELLGLWNREAYFSLYLYDSLTHLLWMKPTPRATVIEFFFPKGFAHDYEFTSRALGIHHFGFWGNEYFTAPDTPEVAYPEGFQGNEIPIGQLEIPLLEFDSTC